MHKKKYNPDTQIVANVQWRINALFFFSFYSLSEEVNHSVATFIQMNQHIAHYFDLLSMLMLIVMMLRYFIFLLCSDIPPFLFRFQYKPKGRKNKKLFLFKTANISNVNIKKNEIT